MFCILLVSLFSLAVLHHCKRSRLLPGADGLYKAGRVCQVEMANHFLALLDMRHYFHGLHYGELAHFLFKGLPLYQAPFHGFGSRGSFLGFILFDIGDDRAVAFFPWNHSLHRERDRLLVARQHWRQHTFSVYHAIFNNHPQTKSGSFYDAHFRNN
jgi:hypothetical protein